MAPRRARPARCASPRAGCRATTSSSRRRTRSRPRVATGRPSQATSHRQSPMTSAADAPVTSRSNGVPLCGATTSSQAHEPSAGVVPCMPPEMALTNASAGRHVAVPRRVRNQPAQHPGLLGERPREDEGHDRHRQPAHDEPGLHRPRAQVAAADRHPEQQVGQPRQARVVAGEQQLGEQVAGVRELVERRAGPGARRQVRPHQVRHHRRDHDPRRRPREQRRAPSARGTAAPAGTAPRSRSG